MNLLAYGDYPDATGNLLMKGGLVTGGVLTLNQFNQTNIREYVGSSYYNYGILDAAGLHPFDGKTTPNMGTANGYSWLKAPRMMTGTTPLPFEVGPLSRVVCTHLSTSQVAVNDSDTPTGGVRFGGAYTMSNLVTTALAAVAQPVTSVFSALGRHATRALESKYIADAMANSTNGWITQLTADASCYTYKRIPKQISTGYGLCEAPRGALGHWIKVEGRKVAKYQCVVPSTWNFGPKESATGTPGPVEQCLIGSTIGTNATDQIVNILRLVHPWDCCIACAVHVVNPEGEEKLKFAIGLDGKPANIEVKE
jgi:Ni,Fe-hydrogenase I large subunit